MSVVQTVPSRRRKAAPALSSRAVEQPVHEPFKSYRHFDQAPVELGCHAIDHAQLSPLELLEKLAVLVPLPRVHLGRYWGCLAPHHRLRGAITPTPRQQGMDEPEVSSTAPHWSWARLLKRVFARDLATGPFCHQGTLRIMAAMTQGEVIRKFLRHLQRAADPPPRAPVRARQASYGGRWEEHGRRVAPKGRLNFLFVPTQLRRSAAAAARRGA